MRALIIGGTRNLGHLFALDLLASGATVTVLNRGITPDQLPAGIRRIRADRGDWSVLRHAVKGHDFDAVLDTALYNGPDARATVDVLSGRVGRYVFLSTGQVYLVRQGAPRPAKELDYAGSVMAEPPRGTPDHESWRYGVEKRDAEDLLSEAFRRDRFPFVSLRLPMVNGERDHYERIRNYLARLDDGGPIVVPSERGLDLRHVYSADVVQAIRRAIGIRGAEGEGEGEGEAINVSQPETLSLDEFLGLLAGIAGRPLRIARVPRAELESRHLLPDASPFSGRWMSALDNARSIDLLGVRYTPLPEYLERIVADHRARGSPTPAGYAGRQAELELARYHGFR